jgi:protein-S-isoprenylcysteine O-methyltransferase
MVAALFTKRPVERVNWQHGLRYGIPVVIGFYLMFSMKLDILWLQHRILPRSEALDISAILITIVGMLFAVWARVYLGRNWSSAPMVREQHELIRSGPYRVVRHPIYTGILLAMIGTFLASGKVRGLLAVLFVWIGWTIKSRIEEEFMMRTFGAQYEEYRTNHRCPVSAAWQVAATGRRAHERNTPRKTRRHRKRQEQNLDNDQRCAQVPNPFRETIEALRRYDKVRRRPGILRR